MGSLPRIALKTSFNCGKEGTIGFAQNVLSGSHQDKYVHRQLLLCETNLFCLHSVLFWNTRDTDVSYPKEPATHIMSERMLYFWSG